MKKNLVSIDLGIIIVSAILGLYASQRNCLFRFFTEGEMNFWTGIEILAGFGVLIGLVIFLTGRAKKK
ncbi:MAG: hypothetical protein CO146_01615 [Candidatus Nealsonbacteria bacterium CG_4_9_14_3_um_filter_37_29]|uniref:Uncharacterized protein n=1 Tax=Candidatus Nealsonbacteria bacterium CG_4_9_14_3_um_filter_37_29 TaxID=1974696 RepID=A0A2M7Z3C1_9BACT|nr:MAG: hypothetical protein CO146_01615 [Candidatus Nealsonbacteria bacterium CG_4_9_14_3_um_filter_37_29]